MGRLYPCLSGIFQTFGDVNDDYDKEDVGCYIVRFPDPVWNFHTGSGNLTWMNEGDDEEKVEGTISQGVLFLLPHQLWSILEGGRVNAMVNGINNITWVVF